MPYISHFQYHLIMLTHSFSLAIFNDLKLWCTNNIPWLYEHISKPHCCSLKKHAIPFGPLIKHLQHSGNESLKQDKHIQYSLKKYNGVPAYLINMVQFGAGPATIIRFLPKPLGPYFDSTAAGLAATGPVWPLAELTVRWARDDTSFLYVTYESWIKTSVSITVSQTLYSFDAGYWS